MKAALQIIPILFLASCSHSSGRSSGLLKNEAGKIAPAAPLRPLQAGKIKEARKQSFFEFSWGDKKFHVGHGVWEKKAEDRAWNQSYGYGPVVWVKEGKRERVLDLRSEFPSHFVSQVFQDQVSKRIFLFLDYGIEGPAPAYVVWISEDGGESWFQGGDLKRPPGSFPPSELESFLLDEKGVGGAWLRLDASQLTPEERGSYPLQAKLYYKASTADGGRAWQVDNQPQTSSVLTQEEERHH